MSRNGSRAGGEIAAGRVTSARPRTPPGYGSNYGARSRVVSDERVASSLTGITVAFPRSDPNDCVSNRASNTSEMHTKTCRRRTNLLTQITRLASARAPTREYARMLSRFRVLSFPEILSVSPSNFDNLHFILPSPYARRLSPAARD